MAMSPPSFISTMALNALILVMFLPFIASQCMDFEGMKDCSSAFNDIAVPKDLLECMDGCLAKPGKVCRFIQWKPKPKLCYVSTTFGTIQRDGGCATFRKKACNTIPDNESLEEDSGNIFKGGQQMTFVASQEECKTVCAIGSTCLAFTWLSERRLCINHRQSWDRSTDKLGKGDYQVINGGLSPKGRCVVLNAGGSSPRGVKKQKVYTLKSCVETVLNTTTVNRVDWNFGTKECWSHKSYGKTNFYPVEGLTQLRKLQGCRLRQGVVSLKKLVSTKMSGGLKLNGLSGKDCVELCQLVSNCAAVGWSGRWGECTFHHLELPTEEDPSTTLYTTGGADITTSTTTTTVSTSTTISTSTEATTAAPTYGTGTFVEAFFIRRDNNQLTSTSQRRASLECAMLCFRSNCSDFTSAILHDDRVCSLSGSEVPSRFPKEQFEWIKL